MGNLKTPEWKTIAQTNKRALGFGNIQSFCYAIRIFDGCSSFEYFARNLKTKHLAVCAAGDGIVTSASFWGLPVHADRWGRDALEFSRCSTKADNCDKFKKNLHRTSEIQEFLPLESGILSLRFRNTAQGIRNPTNDWIARIL